VRRESKVALGGLSLVRFPEGRIVQDRPSEIDGSGTRRYCLKLLHPLDHLRLEILLIQLKACFPLLEIEVYLIEAG
jgi:hypothetical protein